jgi:hypothetical protein
MKNIFKKTAQGKSALSTSLSTSVECCTGCISELNKEFMAMAKGQDSRYLDLNGESKFQRFVGLASAPVLLPLVNIIAVPMSLVVGGAAGVVMHNRQIEKEKKTPSRRDIM